MNKRNPGLSLRVVQGSFRKNSNDSWTSERIVKAVCFLSPFLNPRRDMRKPSDDDKDFSFCKTGVKQHLGQKDIPGASPEQGNRTRQRAFAEGIQNHQ